MGQYARAIALQEKSKAIFEALGDRKGVTMVCKKNTTRIWISTKLHSFRRRSPASRWKRCRAGQRRRSRCAAQDRPDGGAERVQHEARRDQSRGCEGSGAGLSVGGRRRAVVSLWSVDDGSTAALMEQMYQHLVQGCTVPQALRLAMLRLARRPMLHQPVSEKDVADGLLEAWKRPKHWAGFLVMGTSTRLIRIDSP